MLFGAVPIKLLYNVGSRNWLVDFHFEDAPDTSGPTIIQEYNLRTLPKLFEISLKKVTLLTQLIVDSFKRTENGSYLLLHNQNDKHDCGSMPTNPEVYLPRAKRRKDTKITV